MEITISKTNTGLYKLSILIILNLHFSLELKMLHRKEDMDKF